MKSCVRNFVWDNRSKITKEDEKRDAEELCEEFGDQPRKHVIMEDPRNGPKTIVLRTKPYHL